MKINSKLPDVGTNIFSEMSGLARQYGAINLAQGFPNFNPPQGLIDCVQKALSENFHQYAPMSGTLELRNAISVMIQNTNEVEVDAQNEICITSGASQALSTAIQAFVHPGDEVICIEPCYDLYRPSIELNQGVYRAIITEGPDFNMDWQKLEDTISSKTRMIIVNTPSNPTGKVWTKAEWEKLYHIIKNHNIMILSDEVYQHLVFDEKRHVSVLEHPELKHRAIAAFSFGKTFHCTGWKIGYCVAPTKLMREFKKAHQFNVFSVPHFLQIGIANYLSGPDTYKGLGSFYQGKRDLFEQLMADTKFIALPSQGSFFQLYDHHELDQSHDKNLAIQLTKEQGVTTIPISSFYSQPPKKQYLRFCFAKTEDVLEKAADLLRDF